LVMRFEMAAVSEGLWTVEFAFWILKPGNRRWNHFRHLESGVEHGGIRIRLDRWMIRS
jgi:hypothetical protein